MNPIILSKVFQSIVNSTFSFWSREGKWLQEDILSHMNVSNLFLQEVYDLAFQKVFSLPTPLFSDWPLS